MLKEAKAFVELMRPRHIGQIVGIVAIFTIMSHGFSVQSLYAIVSSFFLCIAIFLIDDAHDYESDQIVHPKRPIPRGLVTVRRAYLLGTFFLFVGVLLASTLVFYQFAFYLLSTVIAMAVIFSNIKSVLRAFFNAFLIWSLFPFAAYPDGRIVLFGLVVALPHIGGSIAKDFLHSRGDVVQGLAPPPVWAKYLASGTFFAAGFVVWLPKLLGFVTWFYIPPIVLTHVSCMILGMRVLKKRYDKVYIYGAIGMCSALIAFLLGST
jgi:4-hydroxybenzoate polyprenyltransferase